MAWAVIQPVGLLECCQMVGSYDILIDSNEHWGLSCALLNDDSFVIRKSMIRKIVYPFGYVPPTYVANSPMAVRKVFIHFNSEAW